MGFYFVDAGYVGFRLSLERVTKYLGSDCLFVHVSASCSNESFLVDNDGIVTFSAITPARPLPCLCHRFRVSAVWPPAAVVLLQSHLGLACRLLALSTSPPVARFSPARCNIRRAAVWPLLPTSPLLP